MRNLILPVNEINAALPEKGLVYEIGSGIGALAYELARFKKTRRVIGIDSNEQKVVSAKKNYAQENIDFICTDALPFLYKSCEGVVMSDFLHHLSYTKQEDVLAVVTKKLKKQGVLVIKEIVRDDGILMGLSRLWDFLLYPEDKIYYRARNEWKTLLVSLGYEVKVARAAHWFPGSTFLFVCTQK